MSPCGSWNSTPSAPGHSSRCMPNCGLSRARPAGDFSSSGTHIINRDELPRKTRSPPARRSRAASGIQRYGSAQIAAPYSEMTKSNDELRSGTCSLRPAPAGTGDRTPPVASERYEVERSWDRRPRLERPDGQATQIRTRYRTPVRRRLRPPNRGAVGAPIQGCPRSPSAARFGPSCCDPPPPSVRRRPSTRCDSGDRVVHPSIVRRVTSRRMLRGDGRKGKR